MLDAWSCHVTRAPRRANVCPKSRLDKLRSQRLVLELDDGVGKNLVRALDHMYDALFVHGHHLPGVPASLQARGV